MKEIKIYQVDAFTDHVFGGNSAAVCPLDEWLPAETMQQIAMENNLAETAFFVKQGDRYEIRWFTPSVEVDLCGHATLAAAFVLFNHDDHKGDLIRFNSGKSGELSVRRKGDLLTLDFPADEVTRVKEFDAFGSGFDIAPMEVWRGRTDYMLVYEREQQVATLQPVIHLVKNLPGRGVIVTARGNEVDFVSRFFAPQSGIDEDPVTGSAHTTLTPYWSKVLHKDKLSAIQVSKRKGHLTCEIAGDRVKIAGYARIYLAGTIFL